MKSKYFGEFLVEKNIITDENLVDALIEQISSTPPLCQVVFQNKILPTAKIFEAFRYQQDNQVEFMQACKAMGAWTNEVNDKTNRMMGELRKPLGQILVNKGLIDLKKLTTMLDEFLSQLTVSAIPVVSDAPAPAHVPAPVVEKIDYMEFQPGILMELEEAFDEKKRRMVRIALSLVKDNAGTDPAICKKLMSDVFKIVHALNGLLSLLALEKLSELLMATEENINKIMPQMNERTKDLITSDVVLLTKAMDCAWDLRGSIMSNSTEGVFFSDQFNEKKFSEILNGLKG